MQKIKTLLMSSAMLVIPLSHKIVTSTTSHIQSIQIFSSNYVSPMIANKAWCFTYACSKLSSLVPTIAPKLNSSLLIALPKVTSTVPSLIVNNASHIQAFQVLINNASTVIMLAKPMLGV